MFSSSRIESCLKSFLINVSSSSTQLLVNLKNQKKLSHLLASHRCSVVNSKVYIVIYLLLSVISISNCAANALVDSSSSAADGYNLEELGAIFHKVAYQTSTTTTKRSIIDNVYVPSITTVPTPSLTTFRYVVVSFFFVIKVLRFISRLCWLLLALELPLLACLRYQNEKKEAKQGKNITKRWKLYIHFFIFHSDGLCVCLLSFSEI